MAEAMSESTRDWNPHRYRLVEARRKQGFCAASDLDDYPCAQRGVVLWYGIPFCVQHAPAPKPGHGGWARI